MSESGYRLLSYREQGKPRAGVLIGGEVFPAAALLKNFPEHDSNSIIGLLRHWDKVHAQLDAVARTRANGGMPAAQVELLAPILYPGALFCAGANYWDHLEEMAEIAKRTTGKAPSMTKGAEPWFFLKTARARSSATTLRRGCRAFPSKSIGKAELGVVIARPTRNISEGRRSMRLPDILIVNDLSARDLMKREGTPFIYDWIGQKCFEDGAPMGPWLTPAAYVPDPNNLAIKLWVNGVLKQDSNTRRMVHNIAEQIAYLSRHVTLQPGDVIATGTPAGVGMPRGEFLKVGDEVKIEIESCGSPGQSHGRRRRLMEAGEVRECVSRAVN